MKRMCALILLAGLLLSVASCHVEPTFEASTPTTTSIEPLSKTNSSYAYDYPDIAPAVAMIPADANLIYVSRDYALPADYAPVLQVCVQTYPEKIEMDISAASQFKIMYDAALAGGVEIIPFSGYRSVSRQKSIFDQEISSYVSKGYSRAEAVNLAAMLILPPGCSEHNSGLAMDITRPGVWDTREDFDTTKEFAWLQTNAHRYGFILRYPSDKQSITDMEYEPWHWRFVGIEPATAMKSRGQCLEEYLGITG